MTLQEIALEIEKYMPLNDFLNTHKRLAELRSQEDEALKALAQLQQAYLAAATDQQRDAVKTMVGQIREISRETRLEIRSLNTTIHSRLPLDQAKELYARYTETEKV